MRVQPKTSRSRVTLSSDRTNKLPHCSLALIYSFYAEIFLSHLLILWGSTELKTENMMCKTTSTRQSEDGNASWYAKNGPGNKGRDHDVPLLMKRDPEHKMKQVTPTARLTKQGYHCWLSFKKLLAMEFVKLSSHSKEYHLAYTWPLGSFLHSSPLPPGWFPGCSRPMLLAADRTPFNHMTLQPKDLLGPLHRVP